MKWVCVCVYGKFIHTYTSGHVDDGGIETIGTRGTREDIRDEW